MEAADGSSNKSRLLVKEPIARKGRNKSRAVLHRDSCYLLWHGVVSPVGGGAVMGDSDSSPPHVPPPNPSSSSLSPSPPPHWFLPSVVTHWTGAWWPRRSLQVPLGFSSYQTSTSVLCDLAKFHRFSVPHAYMYHVAFKKRKKSLSRLRVCMWGTKRILKWFKHQKPGLLIYCWQLTRQ